MEYRNKHPYVYHYTSAQTLCHLLKPKEVVVEEMGEKKSLLDCDHLVFLASDILMLNDRKEYRELARLINSGSKNKINKLCNKVIQQIDKDVYGIPFVMSFSFLPNNLSMWRQYAENGSGICLKFDKNNVESIIPREQNPFEYIRSGECQYEKPQSLDCLYEKLHTIMEKYKVEVFLKEDFEKIYREYVFQSAFLKDKSFQNEEEWRIVKFDKQYKFYPSALGFMARTEIKIPTYALKEIQIGPCANELTKFSVKRWVEHINLETNIEITVKGSKTPFRK